MEKTLTITEKVISILFLLIGILFTIQAIEGYISSYIIHAGGPDSYRISGTTYVSNLVNGNLLIISSICFFKRKSFGALLYQFTGIMFVCYAINLDLYDMLVFHIYDSFAILISVLILLPFGLFLFFYYKKRNMKYQDKFIISLLIILGIMAYLYIDLFFCYWHLDV